MFLDFFFFVSQPGLALSNAANWGRHAFQRAVKCSTFPLDTERQRGSGEILPSLFLSLFPSSISLLHGSQDALCGGCGPWPSCQPSHSPWADRQHPEHSVLLDPPLETHTVNKILQLSHRCCGFSLLLLSPLFPVSPSCSFIPSVFSLLVLL